MYRHTKLNNNGTIIHTKSHVIFYSDLTDVKKISKAHVLPTRNESSLASSITVGSAISWCEWRQVTCGSDVGLVLVRC